MKKMICGMAMLILSHCLYSQYSPDEKNSVVEFSIKNLGFNVTGNFTSLSGDIRFDPLKLAESAFNVSAEANSVNTGNNLRDEHLRGSDFFDIATYPRIKMASSKIAASNKPSVFFFYGTLTIKNVSKEISFPFTAEKTGSGYLLKAQFGINREDFHVGNSSILSNTVKVSLTINTKQ